MRETLLFYCQHSLGIGHLTRSFALAGALRERFRVVFLNGGPLPDGIQVPQGVECIDLPPLGLDDSHTVVSRDVGIDVQAARAERRRLIDRAVASTTPALLLVELFPFGRKKFANEILPMIRAARGRGARVACSLRDILVDGRPDQQHHDDRARWLVDRFFDAVIVHSDPAFANLQDSFRPTRPMGTPVWYSGFVVPRRPAQRRTTRGEHLLVSAGGGIVGDALFRAAIDAHRITRRPMRIVAGPLLPEAHWQALRALAAPLPGVTLVRHVSDLAAEMRAARASISQCGYNTALDLVVSGVPALVVPYGTVTENEQSNRAQRLHALGAVLCCQAQPLDGRMLADAIEPLLHFVPRPAALALDGAERTAELLSQPVAPRAAGLTGALARSGMGAPERPCALLRDLMLPALDRLPGPIDVFIRDDDAGWNDAQLLTLLDLTQRCAVPIDLAAIPQAMSRGLARELRKRCDAAHGAVGVHQHGRTHSNHEGEARKCEFGSARSAEQQRDDLMRGQARLRAHFGDLLQPIFTPPWNRCSELTPPLLAEIGFAALSRDRGARPVQGALQEMPVDINWTRHWREGGAPGVAAAFDRAFSERAADAQPLGLMLHHAVMSPDEFSLLMQWLGVLSAHPKLRWRSMRELLAGAAPTTAPARGRG